MTNANMLAETTFPAATAPLAPPRGGRRVFRRIGAVLGGFFTVAALSVAADAVMHATGVFPPVPTRMEGSLFVLAAGYRALFGVLGGYVTARLAPDRPVKHALALGLLGVVVGTAGAAAMWEYGPNWYSLAVIAIAPPTAWLGGRLGAR
jgi:hypothetical protein